MVLIRGEAGIGKTSLVREFVDSVGADAHLLVGSCDDLLAQRPLAAVRDMSRDEPDLATSLAEGPTRLYETIMSLLSRSLRPTLMVIEDVHWADDATLDLIRHIGRRIGSTHSLLILTYRDEDLRTDHPLRFILADLPSSAIRRLSLAGLSRAAVESLARTKGRMTERLFADSGGNPFFVTELLNVDPGDLPMSVVESLRGRVGRLSPLAREAAEMVSVVPGRAPLLMIRSTFEEWTSVLDETEQRGVLVVTPDQVAYRHELARRAIESSLTAPRRILLNERVLEFLRDTEAEAALMVHHAVQPAGGGDGAGPVGNDQCRDRRSLVCFPPNRRPSRFRDSQQAGRGLTPGGRGGLHRIGIGRPTGAAWVSSNR